MGGKGMPDEYASDVAARRPGVTMQDAIKDIFDPAGAKREQAVRAQKAAFQAKFNAPTAKKAEVDWRKPITGNAYAKRKAFVEVAR